MKINDYEYTNAFIHIKNVRDCLIHIACSVAADMPLRFVANGALDELCKVATDFELNIERYDDDIALPAWYRKHEAKKRGDGK